MSLPAVQRRVVCYAAVRTQYLPAVWGQQGTARTLRLSFEESVLLREAYRGTWGLQVS